MNQVNVVSHMIQNEVFNTICQIAVANNADVDETETDADDLLEEDEIEDETLDDNIQVPSTYTNLEEINVSADDNWMVSGSENKTDLTCELGKDSFKDKEELIRAINLSLNTWQYVHKASAHSLRSFNRQKGIFKVITQGKKCSNS
ncbi:hypothetical protein Hanom_Chr17g01561821 [Helianthus anomalus]